jgi:hypothetical protein
VVDGSGEGAKGEKEAAVLRVGRNREAYCAGLVWEAEYATRIRPSYNLAQLINLS